MKVILSALLLILFIGGGIVFTTQRNKNDPPLLSSDTSNIDHTWEKELLSLVEKKNPLVSLLTLRDYIKQYKEVRNDCHSLAHKIGRKSYEKYQDFSKAMTYDVSICNSGYFHGVIEAYFLNKKNIYSSLYTICDGYNDRRCYHGIGHALMLYTDNNLPLSLFNCDTLQEKYRKYCYEGVFMENFTSDKNLHPSKFINSSDPSYPCAKQATKYKTICYYYTTYYFLSLHPGNFQKGLEWCKTRESSYISQCLRGMGAQIMLETLPDFKKAEKMCMSLDRDSFPWCFDGMIGLFLDTGLTYEKNENICSVVRKENQKLCTESLQKRTNWTPKNIL